ncbi:hypothetical protein RIF29_05569 [Crotalaria pallida]|uniref:Uncharacterized protein n=1 Tax=Crotalaria pallida TaxID=3830 RepID=A0AAN9P9U0_CROPI
MVRGTVNSVRNSQETNHMILKDIMEEKQLNFNRPLLSVRRFSTTVASETDYKSNTYNSKAKPQHLPAYKSELTSGPVRNPGTVPFVWEKIPGRPKDESKSQTQDFELPPISPNLPPGRVSKLKQQDTDINGISITEMRTGSTVSNSRSVVSLKEKIQEMSSSDSDDGSEVYLDACDTLSRTDSFSMSCSGLGLGGLDDQEVIQPSRSFSNDRQARDFMIDRFLPAAKAMTSETPQYASCRKPVIGPEQHKQVNKVVSAEKSHPFDQHKPKALQHYIQDIQKEGSKDVSEDCNGSENDTTTACGLFPRFCLLHPIPGLKMEDKVQSSEFHGMQAKSIASHNETTKEHARTPFDRKKPVDSHRMLGFKGEKEILSISEKYMPADSHQRGCSRLLACESTQCDPSYEGPIVEKTLYVDSIQKFKARTCSCSKEMNGQVNGRGEICKSLRRDTCLLKNPSDFSNGNNKDLDFVDVKATIQPKSSESFGSPLLGCAENPSKAMQVEMVNHSKKLVSEKEGPMKPGIQASDIDKNLVPISRPEVVENKKIKLESHVSRTRKKFDSLIQNSEVDMKSQRFVRWVDQECTQGSTPNPSTFAWSKVVDEGKIDLESKCHMNSGNRERSEARYSQLALALPSLKAPSESWLNRILPTISKRNISSRSNNLVANLSARNRTPKTTSLCPNKWESMVKSSNVHHGHIKFPKAKAIYPEKGFFIQVKDAADNDLAVVIFLVLLLNSLGIMWNLECVKLN